MVFNRARPPLITAPIVCVCLETGKHRYDFETASRFLTALDSKLDVKNPGASATLAKHGVDVHDAAWKLSCTLPAIISVAFNPSASQAVLSATVNDIADAVRKARPLENPVSREEWSRRRALTLNAGMAAIAWALKLKHVSDYRAI